MDKKAEKLQLLSDLIDLARVDKEMKEVEEDFLTIIAQRLNLSPEDYIAAANAKRPGNYPKGEVERILQFHRLVLLMNIDAETGEEEVGFLKEVALRMGLNPMSVQKVLAVMSNYPNKVVPPEILLSIFKENFN
ncbi:Tellurite resistance protein TerB [Lishizhenia tianjinensis]|uniref:Tellurite resistance protein TerB n=1 Tax=Lishizhenia tianjinensis TaxID=477690 RepID=A0A1I6YXY9_9FLAO|nr:TerB family tellurite resistance protein [Lishizhenia tianjinensis]SFT55284.1 Tellurite resistance protein TerB [Lishizhenia tianjinensis]